MAAVTLGALATGLGVAWKYRRTPYAFYKWKTTPYQDPAVGQEWAFARLSPLNDKGNWHTFKITEVTEDRVYATSNWVEDSPDEFFESVDGWHARMKKIRGWVIRDTSSIEDQYFGEASED